MPAPSKESYRLLALPRALGRRYTIIKRIATGGFGSKHNGVKGMKLSKTVLIFFLSIFLSWIPPLIAADQNTEIRKSVAATSQKFMETLAKGDSAGLVLFYSNGAQLMPPNRNSISGRAAIAAFWKSAIDFGIKGRQIETTDFFSMGNHAVEIGKYTLTDPKGKFIETGKYILLWTQEGGTWKLHRDMWSSNTSEGCL